MGFNFHGYIRDSHLLRRISANAEPVSFPLEIHGISGSLSALRASSDSITSHEPFTVTVDASADNSFSPQCTGQHTGS